MSQQIAEISGQYMTAFHVPHLARDGIQFSSTFEIVLAKPQSSTNRLPTHIANVAIVASAIVECASYLPTKSSIYAAIVSLWNLNGSRLESGVGLLELLNLDTRVKMDDTDDKEVAQRQKLEEIKFKRDIFGFVGKSVVDKTLNQIDWLLTGGRIEEARNLLRFLMDLTNCHLVDPVRHILTHHG